MLLALDVGNSAVKGAVFDGADLVRVFHLDVAPSDTPGGDEAWRRALESHLHGVSVDHVGIASVVPSAEPVAQSALSALTGAPVTLVSPDGPLPFRLDYQTPQTLGADRLAAAAAAWMRYGAATEDRPARSVLAVDAGTAVTYEVIHRDGVYQGGAIAAGPVLMQRILRSGTAQLPDVPLTFPDRPVGRSTREAMQSGILWGVVDGVAGMIRRLAETLPDDPAVVLTGGWSPTLADRLDVPGVRPHVDAHLVLDGVRCLVGEAVPDLPGRE